MVGIVSIGITIGATYSYQLSPLLIVIAGGVVALTWVITVRALNLGELVTSAGSLAILSALAGSVGETTIAAVGLLVSVLFAHVGFAFSKASSSSQSAGH